MPVVADIDETVIAAVGVRHDGRPERDLASYKILQCLLFRVRDNFGENLAAALNDAKDGALAGAAPGLSGTADAARTARSEVAFVKTLGDPVSARGKCDSID